MGIMARIANLLTGWRNEQSVTFALLFKKFKSILERNNRILELMADMGDKLGGEYIFDSKYIEDATFELNDQIFKLISDMSVLTQNKNTALFLAFERIQHILQEEIAGRRHPEGGRMVLPFQDIGIEAEDEVGGKISQLGDISNRLHLQTPNGFAITTTAFFAFMSHSGLLELAQKGIEQWDGTDQELHELADLMQSRIMDSPLPWRLVAQIDAMIDVLSKCPVHPLRLALRSSAWGEDGDSSFAGQYATELNVPPDRVVEAYKTVIASTYSFEAWRYRLDRGYHENEVAMAVGCQIMADSRISGVLFTCTQTSSTACESMIVSATWGGGAAVVAGETATDTIYLSRTPPYPSFTRAIARKMRRLVPAARGDLVWEDVPENLQNIPCLTDRQLEQLARAGMSLERYYKRPQDVEWTFDSLGELHILQSRPLRPGGDAGLSVPVQDATRKAEIIFAGKGLVAQRGVAVGKVVLVDHNTDLDQFPEGGILVSKFTSPRYARVMRRACGIITDVGSPTGHMATIAREQRVPALVNTEEATRLLRNDDEITLDATQNIVYRGRVAELDRFERSESDMFEESYEYRLLRRLLKHITPLNLVDPHSDDFKPQACKTYHDITRYIHEKAVEALVVLSQRHDALHHAPARRLMDGPPLGLTIIDAGGGTNCQPEAPTLNMEEITSVPLLAFLQGMSISGMWDTAPVPVDLGSFMSSFTRTFTASMAGPETVGRNLAVALRDYMNVNMRLGYHYNTIDAYISEQINDNYIYFRFIGGVTELVRRSRRARFVANVLDRFDFRVEVHGDLVVGRIKKLSVTRMLVRMHMLGGLVGYARQLDARLNSDELVEKHAQAFLEAIKSTIPAELAEPTGGKHNGAAHLGA